MDRKLGILQSWNVNIKAMRLIKCRLGIFWNFKNVNIAIYWEIEKLILLRGRHH